MDPYSKNGRARLFIFTYAPVLLWVAVILALGSGAGSSAQTSRFIKPLIELFFPSVSAETLGAVHAAVRKSAHFVEYAVLAVLAARAFRSFRPASAARRYWAVLSLAVVLIVAAADEIKQSFDPSRTGSPWDVMIDLAGGLMAILGVYTICRIRAKRRPEVPPRT